MKLMVEFFMLSYVEAMTTMTWVVSQIPMYTCIRLVRIHFMGFFVLLLLFLF